MTSHLAHAGSRRPSLDLSQERFQHGPWALRIGADRAIPLIHDIPHDLQSSRDLVREVPEADPLDATRHTDFQ
jgi:hypothetical protein